MKSQEYSFRENIYLRSALLLATIACVASATAQRTQQPSSTRAVTSDWTIAVGSLGPLNTDIFVAEVDGRNARPLVAHPDNDYNASVSADNRWVLFTSNRAGSADLYRVRPDGSMLERLTNDPAFDDQGAFSPDGKSIAFVSTRSGQADVWIMEVETRRVSRLTDHRAGDFRPAWSPDGQWIAFSSQRDQSGKYSTRVPENEIYVVRPDGSGLRRVTNQRTFAGSPSWSRDSSHLIFYEGAIDEVMKIRDARRLRGTTQIVSLDLATGERVVLTSGPGEKWSPQRLDGERVGYASGGPDGGLEFSTGSAGARGEYRSPHWSADATFLVFHRDVDRNWPPLRPMHTLDSQFRLMRTGVFPTISPSGDRLVSVSGNGSSLHNGLVIMNLNGTELRTVYDDPERNALAPAWSPKGDWIAVGLGTYFQGVFGRSAGPVQSRQSAHVAMVRPDGSGLKMLTKGTGNHGFPSWSPDGKHIVYRYLAETGKGLGIIDVESGTIKILTSGPYNDTTPSWSPAGDLIAFTSDRDGEFDIYSIKSDGTGLRRLTDAPGYDGHCAFSPDGQWIAFTSARRGFKDEAALHPANPQPYGDLYVMRPDGSDVRMLTDDQFEDGTVAWIHRGVPY